MSGPLSRVLRGAGVQRSGDALSVDQWMNYFSFNGINYPFGSGSGNYTLNQKADEVDNSFAGYAHGLYRSNGIVFACIGARHRLFTEARFQFRQLKNGRPGDLFGTPALAPLETPWRNGTTGDLLGRALQDVDICGNFFGLRPGRVASPVTGAIVAPGDDRIARLRPDWVTVIAGSDTQDPAAAEVLGYAYTPGGKGSGNDPIFYGPEQIAHWTPTPDPMANWLGMSWLTPVLTEIMADGAAMTHKLKFFEHGATPNLMVTLDPQIKKEQFDMWVSKFKQGNEGIRNAYKTLFLGGGADAKVLGANMQQMDFKTVQGHGETRIASAAGVPPIIVGLSEGLEAATYCLPADEMVWTVDGPRAIVDVRAGDEVWTHMEGGIARRPVTWQGQTGERRVYTIRTKNRTFRATDNHPVLVRVPGNSDGANEDRHATTTWRNVRKLRVGDEVVQAMAFPDMGGTLTPAGDLATADLMQWLGAYVGDGSGACRGAFDIAMPPDDRCRADYEALTLKVFPEVNIRPDVRSFRFHSVVAGRYVIGLGFAGLAKTKRVPGWVFGLHRDLRLAFLAGLVDTDGSVDKRGAMKLQLANRVLVEQIKALAVSCGLQVSNLYEQEYDASVLPNPGVHATYMAWAITISSAHDVAEIPFYDPVYRERVEANVGRHKRCGGDAANAGLDDTLGFFRVVSIEAGEVEPVFDITVLDGHSFFAGGVVVHNSNYGQARRAFADGTMRPLWRGFCSAAGSIIDAPQDRGASELWYDDRDISFLQEDRTDAINIQSTKATTIHTLVTAGFTPDSVIMAVESDDYSVLEHTGMFSVQLLPAGTVSQGKGSVVTGTDAPAKGAGKSDPNVDDPNSESSSGKPAASGANDTGRVVRALLAAKN